MMVVVRPRTLACGASLLLALSSGDAAAEASQLADDYTITAVAPPGLRRTDLGRPYSANFQPVTGKDGLPLFPAAPDRKAERASQFDYQIVAVSNSHELKANASGWGVSAGLKEAASKRYLAYRVYQISSIDEVDDRSEPRQVSTKAAYYVRRIFYGEMVEYVCSADASAFTADVRADFGVVSGSVGGFEKRHKTKCRVKGRGIDAPDTSKAMFVQNASDIKDVFSGGKATPVPILVEYRRVPNTKLDDVEEYDWKAAPTGGRVASVVMSVDAMDSGWQSSGITLAPGDGLLVVASGEIVLNRAKDKKAAPGTVDINRQDLKVAPAAGALRVRIGRNDQNSWYFMLTSRFAYVATDDVQGEVSFQIKDSNYTDNGGAYRLVMMHVPAALKEPDRCVNAEDCAP